MALTPGLQIPYGVQPVNPVPVDTWSGPYTGATEVAALSAANISIPAGVRFKSLEVRLIIAGVPYKYWYYTGTTDSDLALFSGGGGGAGTSGYSGYSGGAGASGYSGADGTSGYSGYSGIDGSSGYSGVIGSSGYSGEIGYSGYSGYSGPAGQAAASGYSGFSGEIGASGYSGVSGYSGSGVSGYSGSGVSGFSGYSGLNAPLLQTITYNNSFTPGQVIYKTSGGYALARADAVETAEAIGVIQDANATQFTIVINGAISNLTGIVDAAYYYLSESVAGGLTTTAPELSGQVIKPVLIGTSTTTGIVVEYPGVLIEGTNNGFSGYLALWTGNHSLGNSIIQEANGTITINGIVNVTGSYQLSGGAIAASGYSGYSGHYGVDGSSGYSGKSGYSGDSTSGYSGISGWSGYSGSGVSGYSGLGLSGYSGYSGISGYSGTSGWSGYSGIGTSGYSGISGYSGNSGLGVTASFARGSRSTTQVSGLSAGGVIYFNQTDTSYGSDITLNNANGVITLEANKTYRLIASVPTWVGSSARPAFGWYNNTTSGYIGSIQAGYNVQDSPANSANPSVAEHIFTPNVNTDVTFRLASISTGSLSQLGNNSDFTAAGSYPWFDIEVIAGQAPSMSGYSGYSGTGYTGTTGSWTLSAGANTVSFTVPIGNTYTMWVNGNIPNGICVWNATATVTNNNVPVIGVQYAWYYLAGNALALTSIPAQILGTAGTISTDSPAVGTTTNVFTFGITNNSGSSQVVNWGYVEI
jgi:hypothetical protein